MKNKQFEYEQLAQLLLQEQKQPGNKDIGIYAGIFQLGKVGRILVYLVGLIIGFIVCVLFNISFWWTLLFAIVTGEIIGLYVTLRGNKYSMKLLSEQVDKEHLREICNNATNFIITIVLKTTALGKHNKQIDIKKAKEYYNHIALQQHDGGWLFSGRKPLYIQKDLTKESEIVFTSAYNEFIANKTTQNIVFPCPKVKSTKQIYNDFNLILDDESVSFRDSNWWPYENYPGTNKTHNDNLNDITIWVKDMKKHIFERIVKAFQPYNDNVNDTINYWSKTYLFKSDEYRKQKLKEYSTKRTEYETSEEFAKIKYGPFGKETTTDSASYNMWVNPKGKIKYTHKYEKDSFSHSLIVGCIHTFETEFFIITIRVNNEK